MYSGKAFRSNDLHWLGKLKRQQVPPTPGTPQEGGADAVRVLGDGCAHLHLRTPLPMRGVRILPLELHGGEHVWPEELR